MGLILGIYGMEYRSVILFYHGGPNLGSFELCRVRGTLSVSIIKLLLRYQKNLPLSWSCKYNHRWFFQSVAIVPVAMKALLANVATIWLFTNLPDCKGINLHLYFFYGYGFRQLQLKLKGHETLLR
jgi:hypothetical protein